MVKPASKPKVSSDEKNYRKENVYDILKNLKKEVVCTGCNASVKNLITKCTPKSHPFLDTLLCNKCFKLYGDGESSVDEDGTDKYCRWCGQGGTLYMCGKCTAGFCKKCIKRNLARSVLQDVQDDDWECFCCDIKPLYKLRALCWAAKQFAKQKGEIDYDGKSKKRQYSDDSDSEDNQKSKKLKSSSKSKNFVDSDDSKSSKYSPRSKPKIQDNESKQNASDYVTKHRKRSHDSISKVSPQKSAFDKNKQKLLNKTGAKLSIAVNDIATLSKKVTTFIMNIRKKQSFTNFKSLDELNVALTINVLLCEFAENKFALMKNILKDFNIAYNKDFSKIKELFKNENTVENGINDKELEMKKEKVDYPPISDNEEPEELKEELKESKDEQKESDISKNDETKKSDDFTNEAEKISDDEPETIVLD